MAKGAERQLDRRRQARSLVWLLILKMTSRSERVKALLARVCEEQGAITSVNDLRDFALEAEEDKENKMRNSL